ncbi:Single-stranded DNA-binding protein 3 [Lamellibrachia satsuma]|nr:Single-stranded DNA-binding protein 3 [Lamellibrachia satsuma]
MYAKGKGSTVPSDGQAREKLALYVYEYLLHVGAQKSAQTFLSEIRWEKNITLGEPPGFLHSWWCVFWDLYCAAPERRDTCDHSSEAKAFHDYGFVNSGYGVNGMAHNPSAPSPLAGQLQPQDGMPGAPMPGAPMPGAPMPGANMPGPYYSHFISPRYPGGARGPVRMLNQVDFNQAQGGPAAGQMPMMGMPNSMDMRPGHPNMVHMQRMAHPGSRMPGPMNPTVSEFNHCGGIRGPPPSSMGPGGPAGMGPSGPAGMGPGGPAGMGPGGPAGMGPGGPGGMGPGGLPGMGPGGPGGMTPLSMPQTNRPWPPNTAAGMNYSSPSPGSFNGPPNQGPPGTPIMPSPQGSAGPYSPQRLPRRDSTNSGENMYGMMKPSIPGSMPGQFPGMPGADGGMGPLGPDMSHVMNGDGMAEALKNSPHNGRGTPRDDIPPGGAPGDMVPYNLQYQDNPDHNESAEILKIKQSMQEEAKRFEKDTPNDPSHPEYFMSQ